MTSRSGRGTCCGVAFCGVRHGRLAHPAPVIVSLAACGEPLAIAGAVALEHFLELVPVDGAEAVVLRNLVPGELGIGHFEAQELRLRRREVDELLPELIVREALDLPAHRLRAVLRVRVRRTE